MARRPGRPGGCRRSTARTASPATDGHSGPVVAGEPRCHDQRTGGHRRLGDAHCSSARKGANRRALRSCTWRLTVSVEPTAPSATRISPKIATPTAAMAGFGWSTLAARAHDPDQHRHGQQQADPEREALPAEHGTAVGPERAPAPAFGLGSTVLSTMSAGAGVAERARSRSAAAGSRSGRGGRGGGASPFVCSRSGTGSRRRASPPPGRACATRRGGRPGSAAWPRRRAGTARRGRPRRCRTAARRRRASRSRRCTRARAERPRGR